MPTPNTLQARVRRVLLEVHRLEIGASEAPLGDRSRIPVSLIFRGPSRSPSPPLQLYPLWILFRPAEDVWNNNSIIAMRGLQTQIVIPRALVFLCNLPGLITASRSICEMRSFSWRNGGRFDLGR
jgi:hypothetical protein